MPRPIIIDCDPGQDDAVALFLAMSSPDELDLLGVTTVAGNVPLEKTQRNARIMCDIAARFDVPVFAGCNAPMHGQAITAEYIHGDTGIDGVDVFEPETPLQETHAVTFIIETLKQAAPDSVTLVPTGPMTNIGTAIEREPAILASVQRIVSMGGAMREGGNRSPSAEFNVLADHALIVTRSFEEQESLLGSADFAALADCLDQIDGLCFYNAGAAAGASQRHKHLQLVPIPLGEGPERIPIERLFEVDSLCSEAASPRRSALPFRHALIRVDDCLAASTGTRAAEFEARYHQLRADAVCEWPQPYNLLVTREWMLLVPRACESSHGIGVNALGLAGALFVRDREQHALLASLGPMRLLRDVTFPAQ